MKNFFVPGLGPEKKNGLQEAGIAFCDMEIDGSPGIVLEESELTKALEVLDASVGSEGPTSFEGIFKISLSWSIPSAVATQPRVVVGEWYSADGRNPDEFVRAVENILLPVVGGRGIVVTNSDRKPRVSVPADGRFHLFVGYGQRTGGNTPDTVFGVRIGKYTELAPEGEDPVLTDPETGLAALQYKSNAAWVLVNIAHHGGQKYEYRAFRRILEEFAAEISLSQEERGERQRCLNEERRQRSREQYVRECSSRFEKTMAGTVQAISDGKNEIARLQQALVKKIREAQGAERKLAQLSACKGGELEKYGQEFDKLLAISKVRDVQVADGVVKVFTDTLTCIDPRSGKRHEIGAFRIEIYTSGANNGVRWFNLTRQIDGYSWGKSQAPHINGEGNACLGTMAEIVPELVANYEFAALAMVAIQFVESVNVDDSAGKYIDRWPEVSAKEE